MPRKSTAGLPGKYEQLGEGRDSLTWETLARDTHQTIIEIARSRPDARFVVKSKDRSREFEDTLRMLGGRNAALPPNLEVVVGGDPFELLTASSVVVGFNTTGLLEGLAAGKPVIVPSFGETRSARARDYIVDLGTTVEYASSPQELVAQINRHLNNPHPVPAELPETRGQHSIIGLGTPTATRANGSSPRLKAKSAALG